MIKVRIAGVPEHFNLPWHMAIAEGAFADRGLDITWTDVPEGTGRMAQMLMGGDTDLAIILTEGILKSIAEGNPSRIVQEYIASPLQWGVHVAASSEFKEIRDLATATAAISRFGSGSHLMAFVNARKQGWDTTTLQFNVINTIEGAVEALSSGQADYFLWERFTTKPLVDQGVFRHLGNCPTPWPCFVIAAGQEFLINNNTLIKHILEVINTYTADFKSIPSIDRTLANRYDLNLDDVKEWLSITQWSQSQISDEIIDNVEDTLIELNLLSKKDSGTGYTWKISI